MASVSGLQTSQPPWDAAGNLYPVDGTLGEAEAYAESTTAGTTWPGATMQPAVVQCSAQTR